MKLLKPVNLIIADPENDVAAPAADLETLLVSRTSEGKGLAVYSALP